MKITGLFISLCLMFWHIAGTGQNIPTDRTVNWHKAGIIDSSGASLPIIDFAKSGGHADGVTPNDAVFSKILSDLKGNPGTIYFPKGSYFFKKTLNIPSGTALKGYSEDSSLLIFSLQNEDHLVKLSGSASKKGYPVSGDMDKGSYSIFCASFKNFEQGDYVKIYDEDSLLVTSSWAKQSTGQIAKIDSIKDSIIYLNDPLRRNFDKATAYIVKLNMVQFCSIENLKFIRRDSTSSQTSNLCLNYAANCLIKCIESEYANFAHVELDNCTNIEVSGSYFHKAFSYGGGGKGYGVVLQFNTGECLISNNNFDSLRHALLLQAGANGNVCSYNYSRHPYWVEAGFPDDASGDIVLHGNYPYANLFEGNVVQNIIIDNSHGRNGTYNTFFRNRMESYGLSVGPDAADSQNFVGNETTNTAAFMGGFELSGTNHFLYGNNKTGTIIPPGTDQLKQASLYLDSIPAYYKIHKTWPPIGIPDQLNEFETETEDYFDKGFLTSCSFLANYKDTTKQDTTVKDTTATDTTHSSIHKPADYQATLSVFPNPAQNILEIRLSGGKAIQIKEIRIYNLSGAEVIRKKGLPEVNISGLTDGLYFISVLRSDHSLQFGKFSKITKR